MKKLMVLSSVVCAMLCLCACGSSSKKLVMATNAAFPPYESVEGNEIIGIDPEIAKLIADDLGRELVIEDMAFVGHGCAISQASTSLMIDCLRGKTLKEAKEIIHTFISMIKKEIKDEKELEKLEEAIALKNVSNMPARVKCACLAWYTLESLIDKNNLEVENG